MTGVNSNVERVPAMSSTYPTAGAHNATPPFRPSEGSARENRPGSEPPEAGSGNLKDEAHRIASELGAQGSKAAEDLKAAKQELGSAAADKAEALAEQGKQAGYEGGVGLANAARRAADDLEGSSPEIARHVRTAADSIESVANSLRERSVGDLMHDATGFARQQPAAFFGAAVLAGFAIARFAKSSASSQPTQASSAGSHGTSHGTGTTTPPAAGRAPGWVPATGSDGSATVVPATTAAATLGGAAAHKPGDAEPGSMPTIGKEPL